MRQYFQDLPLHQCQFLIYFVTGLIDVNVSLTPELEQLVTSKLNSGMYQTASEVIREALRLLQQRDEHLRGLRAEVQAGLDQFAQGEYSEHDRRSGRALMNNIKARGRKRLLRKKNARA